MACSSMGSDRSTWVRTLALATTIPMVLVVGPLLGFGLGVLIERRWPTAAPWGTALGTAIGIAAGARQAWQLICQIQSAHNQDDQLK